MNFKLPIFASLTFLSFASVALGENTPPLAEPADSGQLEVAKQKPDQPVTDAKAPGTSIGEIQDLGSGGKVQVTELKRTAGDTITVKFKIINDTKEKLEKEMFGGNQNGWNASKVALLDMQNKKKYLVMRDSENNPVSINGDFNSHGISPGQTVTFWAKFQAPPETVTKLSVEIPQAPPFEDVVISR